MTICSILRSMHKQEAINSADDPKVKTHKLVEKHVGLEPDEHVILLVRKHWVVFRNSTILALFVPFVLLFLVFFITNYPLNWPETFVGYAVRGLFGLSAITFILGSIGFMWRWYIWNHTFYVMTNKKLAVINQYNPWNYEVQQISLSNVNDVTLKQEGMEALLYGYSDVTAVTFSGSVFTFQHVAKAPEVQKAVVQQLALQRRPDFLTQINSV